MRKKAAAWLRRLANAIDPSPRLPGVPLAPATLTMPPATHDIRPDGIGVYL